MHLNEYFMKAPVRCREGRWHCRKLLICMSLGETHRVPRQRYWLGWKVRLHLLFPSYLAMRSVYLHGFALRTSRSLPFHVLPLVYQHLRKGNWTFFSIWQILQAGAASHTAYAGCWAQVSTRGLVHEQKKWGKCLPSSFLSGKGAVNPWGVEEASCCPSDR